ncbi:hypothetical protein K438DRAFT_1764261 [Mycena galopus ATCC 62051]|nr:hypothetical protein K438DRAFT_1764261 [Mycena galopus ATCC 62051]
MAQIKKYSHNKQLGRGIGTININVSAVKINVFGPTLFSVLNKDNSSLPAENLSTQPFPTGSFSLQLPRLLEGPGWIIRAQSIDFDPPQFCATSDLFTVVPPGSLIDRALSAEQAGLGSNVRDRRLTYFDEDICCKMTHRQIDVKLQPPHITASANTAGCAFPSSSSKPPCSSDRPSNSSSSPSSLSLINAAPLPHPDLGAITPDFSYLAFRPRAKIMVTPILTREIPDAYDANSKDPQKLIRVLPDAYDVINKRGRRDPAALDWSAKNGVYMDKRSGIGSGGTGKEEQHLDGPVMPDRSKVEVARSPEPPARVSVPNISGGVESGGMVRRRFESREQEQPGNEMPAQELAKRSVGNLTMDSLKLTRRYGTKMKAWLSSSVELSSTETNLGSEARSEQADENAGSGAYGIPQKLVKRPIGGPTCRGRCSDNRKRNQNPAFDSN